MHRDENFDFALKCLESGKKLWMFHECFFNVLLMFSNVLTKFFNWEKNEKKLRAIAGPFAIFGRFFFHSIVQNYKFKIGSMVTNLSTSIMLFCKKARWIVWVFCDDDYRSRRGGKTCLFVDWMYSYNVLIASLQRKCLRWIPNKFFF